jgi:uncharacterized membrane protein YdfJ with MMPL/SSD domain
MFFHLGKIVTRFRWLIVGLWMVAIAIALPFAPQATQVLHSGGFVSPDFESEQAINLLAQKLHFNPTIVQVIFTSSRYSADSPEFTQEAQQALTRMRNWSEVSSIISFTDNPRQISFDRHAGYVNVLLKADPDTAPKLVPQLEGRLQSTPDLQTYIGGGPVFFADIQLVSERDLRRAEILAFPFALIALLLVSRGNVLSPDNIRKLYLYVQRIQADPRVARVDSIVSADPRFTLDQYELLYTHPQLIADPYLSALVNATVAGNTLEISVISKYDMLDQRSQALVQAIRNTHPGGGIMVLVDGGTAGDIDYVNSLYTDFPKAIVVVALTTYIVLLLLFRSLVLPLKAILMNTLSILASYGALVVIFQNGFLHQVLGFLPLGFVEASSPILLFFALFGLSMDYEVFLLSRVQESFWQTGDNTRSVALGLQRSGGIITSAATIVVVVSASFATADVILVKAFGLGMALAVLLDATFVRALLVPATMRLLGTLNWWLPFAGVQRHPPALAKYRDAGESEAYMAQAMQDESMKDATMGGKQ